MITWAGYCADCEKFGMENPYADEADFNRAYGISEYEQAPLIIEPKKDHRKAAASLDNFIKIAESSKRRRAVRIAETTPKKPLAQRAPKMSSEEAKRRRNERLAKRRAAFKEQGLTAKGTIPIPRKEGMTKKEMTAYKAQKMREQRAIWKAQGLNNKGEPFKKVTKEKHLEYAKTYQAKNREKYLAYRREWREKNKERINAQRMEWEKNTCTLQEVS